MTDALGEPDAQALQHFVAQSPWDHRPVLQQIARDAAARLGGEDNSCLILYETSLPKKGRRSVGVARQWSGRQGKVDTCQVAVFAALSNGRDQSLIDMRLYLPKEWVEDPARCDRAGVPEADRRVLSKANHALAMIRDARKNGVQFQWVGIDAGYGKDPAFLRAVADAGGVFVADVHSSQRVWLSDPGLPVPERKSVKGGVPRKRQTSHAPLTVDAVAANAGSQDWHKLKLSDTTQGDLTVESLHRRVWLWDGVEDSPRQWHLIVRREVNSPTEIKYSLSNAAPDTPCLRLAQMQGHRFWVERAFQDAKSFCGLGDYQRLGWRARHHYVAMVLLAMLFVLEHRQVHSPEVDFLTVRDIVALLNATFPPPDNTPEAVVRRINSRHAKRAAAERSRRTWPRGRTEPLDNEKQKTYQKM